MFVKQALRLLLFLTILYAENVTGIHPEFSNGALVSASETPSTTSPSIIHQPSTSTLETPIHTTVIQIGTEKAASKATPIFINHNQSNATVLTTTSPSTTSTTPSTTTAKMVSTTTLAPSSTNATTPGKSNTTKQESVITVPTTSSPSTTTTNGSSTMSMERKNGYSKTTAAGIVALICVTIASTAFASLVAWRYVYRKRHGNREILINEEDVDFNDEDLRHFEATCIQLEPDA